MELFILIAVAASAIAFVYWCDGICKAEVVRARLGLVDDTKIPNGLLINMTRPVWRALSGYFVNLKLLKLRSALNKMFVGAGIEALIKVEEFWGFQIVLAFALGLVFGWFGLCFGLVFPIVWLRGIIKKRKEEMVRALPDVLDVLTLSVEAGLDFMSALSRVVNGAYKDQLIEEFKRMLDEIRVGATKSDALRHLSARCDLPAISSFTALLIQADRLGASVGPVLRAQSEKLRTDRFQRAERAGAVAAQKILFPLVFCIIPAVFIVIFGPVIVQFVSGGIKLW